MAHRGGLVAWFALTLFLVARGTSAQPTANLPAEAQARLARAQDALRAGSAKEAAEIGAPLFDAYPDDYAVQDLRCQSAILQFLPREEIQVQCAGVKRLGASAARPPAAQSGTRPAAREGETPSSESAQAPASEPAPASEQSEQPEASETIVNAREATARRYRGLRWNINPGGVFLKNGSAGFSLGGELEYGLDTGGIIVMPGVSAAGYFVQPGIYVEMATTKLVLPVGSLALFIEGGAGIGEFTNAGLPAPAAMGEGGFAFHPGPSLILGLEAGYEALFGTSFQMVLFGPIFAVSF